MKDGKPVLAFVGHGRSGKDTACELFRDRFGGRFAGGCSFTVLPHIAADLGKTPEQAFAERHLDRMFWYEWCNRYRAQDPARIIRESLAHSGVICGVRDRLELLTAMDEGLIDLVVWVERDVPPDPTLKIHLADADIVVRNDASQDVYERRLARLFTSLGFVSQLTCNTAEPPR